MKECKTEKRHRGAGMRCFECIRLASLGKIKWAEVDTVACIFNGRSYCYRHLYEEVGWRYKEEVRG